MLVLSYLPNVEQCLITVVRIAPVNSTPSLLNPSHVPNPVVFTSSCAPQVQPHAMGLHAALGSKGLAQMMCVVVHCEQTLPEEIGLTIFPFPRYQDNRA